MMETRLPTQAKAAPASSFAPARGGILQRKCACGGTTGPSGECEACREKKRHALQRFAPSGQSASHDFGKISVASQPALKVNRPDDRFEREADTVADLVVNGGSPSGLAGLSLVP